MFESPSQQVPVGYDSIANLVRHKFRIAQDHRRDVEQERWVPAEEAYQGKFGYKQSSRLSQVQAFLNLTRRKVQGAEVKITSMLFEKGQTPFRINVSRRPRFLPPDLLPGAESFPDMTENERQQYIASAEQKFGVDVNALLQDRADNLENRIRDILDQSGYIIEASKAVHEMCLHGTGIVKAPVLVTRNFPVYRGQYAQQGSHVYRVEKAIESEASPVGRFVSIFNLFPSPEAVSFDDAEYIIERQYISSVEARQIFTEEAGFDVEAVLDVVERGVTASGTDGSEAPDPHKTARTFEEKEFEYLEFYGVLDRDDLDGQDDLPEMDEASVLAVKICILGDRTIQIVPHPYDGVSPYHSAYWHRNTQSIWGDGIYWAIRDLQSSINFAINMYIEGKHLSSLPMMAMDESALAPGEDLEVYAGKVWRMRSGQAEMGVKPFVIPDVTGGLMELLQFLERQADLASGQTAVGYGDSSPHQTKTATGMSILNTNQMKQTASVVRAVSEMIRRNIEGIYRWLMTDSDDNAIKLDAEAVCLGYERYVAEEVHNQQILQFLQIASGFPEMMASLKMDELMPSVLRAFSLDPQKLLKEEEELAAERQSAEQQQQSLTQQQLELEAQKAQQQARLQMLITEHRILQEEKAKIGEDRRDLLEKERLARMQAGEALGDVGDMSQYSFLLKDKLLREEQEAIESEQQMQMQAAEQEQLAQQIMREEQNDRRQAQPMGHPAVSGGGVGGHAPATGEPPSEPQPYGDRAGVAGVPNGVGGVAEDG